MSTAIRRQYRANHDALRRMYLRAVASGRSVSGYSADQLAVMVADYFELSRMSDRDLAAHLAETRAVMAARLQELRGR